MSHTFAPCKKCHSINRILIEKVNEALCGKCQNPIRFEGLVSEVSTEEFKKIIRSSDKLVAVDFWASWCGPCKMYGPEFQKASVKNTQAVFLKVNTEAEVNLSQELGIRGIPCTIFFKGGKEIRRESGAMNAETLGSLISSLP